jgi:uncharacterized protein
MINVIYLHGFASGPDSSKAHFFRDLLNQKNINVIIPDLNLPDFADLTISRALRQIQEIADSLEGDIHLMGSSLGGYMAALFSEQENRVQSMVLLAPAFEFPSRQSEKLSAEEIRNWKETGYREMFHFGTNKTAKLRYTFAEDAMKYPDHPCTRNLPTVIFHGVNDNVVDYNVSINHLRRNSKTKLVLLHSDHSLGDQLDTMAGEVAVFFQ